MLEAARTYFEKAIVTLEKGMTTQSAGLDQAARWIADSLKAALLSTVAGAAILQALVAEVAKRLHGAGVERPIWLSANVPGGDQRLAELAARYSGRRLKAI